MIYYATLAYNVYLEYYNWMNISVVQGIPEKLPTMHSNFWNNMINNLPYSSLYHRLDQALSKFPYPRNLSRA